MKTLGSKKILVTGAEGALGKAVVNRFLKDGPCEITGTYFQATPSSVKGVEWAKANLSNSASVEQLISGKHFDVLIHCAGGFRYAKVEDSSQKDWEFLVQANLQSSFLLLKNLLPGMKQRNFGRLFFVSAKATLQPGAGVGVYAATKAGINMLVGSVAEEVKDFNININAILPSIIDTPANRKDMPNSDFSKWVRLEQLAEILFTLSMTEVGDPIHGALIPVAGRV